MLRNVILALVATSMLTACANRGYTVVAAPQKSEQDQKAATTMAEHIFPITHERSLQNLQTDLAKPENQDKMKDIMTSKLGSNDLGECMVKHGFGDYFTQRVMADMKPQKLREETIRLWVEQIPMEMFKKADQNFNDPQFRKTYMRVAQMEKGDVRDKLNTLVSQHVLTDAQANDFFLTIEDRDMKSFLIITSNDGHMAIHNLLDKYKENPAGLIHDFMKTHPDANAACSMVKGKAL